MEKITLELEAKYYICKECGGVYRAFLPQYTRPLENNSKIIEKLSKCTCQREYETIKVAAPDYDCDWKDKDSK